MKYLLNLKKDLNHKFHQLTADKTSLFIVNGNLPTNSLKISYIARFLLIDTRNLEPFAVIAFIRQWFANQAMDIPDIHFSCEVIDLESYDLQIDIALTDKIKLTDDGYQLCDDPVWSDKVGGFVKSSILKGSP